jgi:hypothetical protein
MNERREKTMTRTPRQLAAGLFLLLLAAAFMAAPGSAAPPPISIATGQDAGWPDVRGWNRGGTSALQLAPWGTNALEFAAYPTYQYGVRVAVGDVNGDSKAEIVTAPGKGAWTELRVFDGTSFKQLRAVLPFKNGIWWNGAFVAAADTTGDGRAEIVDGLDAGCCTLVSIVDASTGAALSGFRPIDDHDETGSRVAAADLNGDAKAEILTLPLGGGRVSAFGTAGGSAFRTYQAFGNEAVGGASLAAGDVVGNARPELIVAASTPGGVQVKVIDTESGATLASLSPYGVYAVAPPQVAVGDVDGDGRGDIVLLAQLADGTQLRVLTADGRQLASFFVLESGILPGASLAVGDLDGDRKAEIVLGGGPTPTAPWPPVANGADQRVVVYRLDGKVVGRFTAYPGLFQGGVRVALADVEHNGRPAVITAPGPGMEPEIDVYSQRWLDTRDRGTRLGHFLAYESSFSGGVNVAAGYSAGDPILVTAPGPGRAPEVRVFDSQGRRLASFMAFEIVYTGGLSVGLGDLDADGRPEIAVGTLAPPARIRVFGLDGTPRGSLIAPFPPEGSGVQVAIADLAGTGRGAIVAGEAGGPDPLLETIDPTTGTILRSTRPASDAQNGLRLGAGDLDQDGRDEILVATGFGGDGEARILGPGLQRKWSLGAYTFPGWGMNVAAAPRIGLPVRASGVVLRMVARTRAAIVVGRFHDVAGSSSSRKFHATIDWGDDTHSSGAVVSRPGGDYVVRGAKRYATRGRYDVTVTLTDGFRTAVARSIAIVRPSARWRPERMT